MAEQHDLLIEIGTEELPPKALLRLSDAFASQIGAGLGEAGLLGGTIEAFATPRRLAVIARAVAACQPDRDIERRGPALNAAFDADGQPTRAAQGFARSCGVEVDALERLENEQGSWLVYRMREQGQPIDALLPTIVQQALDRLPIPKRMRWGSGSATFVRPVHWIVLLHGERVIETELLGIRSGRESIGHRFHHPQTIALTHPGEYVEQLRQGWVIAAFAERREQIREQVLAEAAKCGGRAVIDEALLDEVTAMVEWPVALTGSFEERFLDVPQEALIGTMKANQKYFHVVDAHDRLLPRFITVCNIASRRPESVRAGNERVVRPRLADAAFFWEQDRKRPLAERSAALADVVFQKRLGSLLEKSQRVARLARTIAPLIDADPETAERAAQLAKCDLLTEMVGEFPELQGVMGRYYARHDGEPDAVAEAIDEHYRPRQAGDAVATSPVGQAVAIADRLDTLTGIFGIGQPPSGDKDPFALRRAALGLLRTVIERQLDALDLPALIDHAITGLGERIDSDGLAERIYDFMMERLRIYYEELGIPTDTFNAVLALRPARPADFGTRLHAVQAFRARPEAAALAAANKRTGNILRKAEVGDAPLPFHSDALQEPAEQQLAEALSQAEATARPLLDGGHYADALTTLAGLRAPIDAFFDAVMVMADDDAVRNNRLALLQRLRHLFLEVADLSLLQEAG